MKIRQIIKTSIHNVFHNRLRTALTMLGLVIGISSVIVLVGMGDGSNKEVDAKMKALGGDVLSVFVYQCDLHYENLDEIRTLPDIKTAAPSKAFSQDITLGALKSKRSLVEATDETYLETRNLKLSAGRNLSPIDLENKSKVCVIGSEVANDLFNSTDVVGKKIKVAGDEFIVVGILENQGQSMGMDTSGLVLLPFTTAINMGADSKIDSIYAKAENEDDVESTKGRLVSYFTSSIGFAPGTFSVMSQDEMLNTGGEINETMTMLLGGIASISLIVAGIGVMNVMLVSVAERIREIGIKKALGARRSDILLQFLTEALVLSIAGGIIGIIVGIAFGYLSNSVGFAFIVSWDIVIVAVVASTVIGLVFGIFPAYRASRMNPIDALRQD